jgi:hypothetical protein
MSYGSQSSSRGSRRGSGRGRGITHHKKGKRKKPKHRSGGKYPMEANEAPTFEEVAEKALSRLHKLMGQTFACSPFSQYFDDWLLSLDSVICEFETNPAVNVDEEFVKERSQVIADVELKLAERRNEEAVFKEATRMLAEQKTLLVQTDTECSYSTQNLAAERKSKIKGLTRRVHDLDEEIEETLQTKVSIFSPLARRAQSHKKAELNRKLDAAKSELDLEVKSLEAEQEQIRDDCEKKKQAIMEQVRILEKKVRSLEADGSVDDRRFACEELVNSVKSLLRRKKTLQ